MNSFVSSMKRLLAIGKDKCEHLFHRHHVASPVLFHRVRRISSGPPVMRQRAAEEPEVMEPDAGDPLEQALDDYMSPQHAQHEHMDFTEIGPDGRLHHKSEVWERRNNAMEQTVRERRPVVSSGLVVPAGQVAVRCQNPKCGKYEAAPLAARCSRCGRLFCAACIKAMPTAAGVLHLCPDDCRREIAEYDTWSAVDANLGKRPGIPIIPERPFAVMGSQTGQKKR